MKIELDTAGVESGIGLLRTTAERLQANRWTGNATSLSRFSTAGGLDEAGERLSPIGDERAPEAKDACIQYIPTTVENKDFAYGGNVPVKFNFDKGSVEVSATVSAPTLASGQHNMDFSR